MKSRSGSYKKVLIDEQILNQNAEYLRTNIAVLEKMNLKTYYFVTLYLLLYLRIKHSKNWLQQKTRVNNELLNQNTSSPEILSLIPSSFNLNDWEKEKLKNSNFNQLFSQFNLKGIPESINRTMLNWMDGKWKIELLFHIPSSRELLRLQVKNTRCITAITHPEQITTFILGSRDPLSFVLHDLMHADQFFNQQESQKGQLGFYHLINNIYDFPEIQNQLKSDKIFKKEFEYIASDMNAYVIHLFKCLKSAIYKTDESGTLFQLLLKWWNMTDNELQAAHKLNTPQFLLSDELQLKNYFENNQEII